MEFESPHLHQQGQGRSVTCVFAFFEAGHQGVGTYWGTQQPARGRNCWVGRLRLPRLGWRFLAGLRA